MTGDLGGAAAGLKLLENSALYEPSSNPQNALLSRQLIPFPQVRSGKILANKKLASAMIDSSDGLSSDLIHLCAASSVGARIEKDKIPIHYKLKNHKKYPVLREFNFDIFSLALDGGEDYQLIFTVNPKNLKKLKKHLRGVSQIGEIVELNLEVTVVDGSQTKSLTARGFRHF